MDRFLKTSSLFLAILISVISQEAIAQIEVEFHEEKRHHISVFSGGTTIFHTDEAASTIGLDYEYRINRLLGVGFVVEQAFGSIDATTILTVADIHIWRGLALQIGPGIEILNEETEFGGEESATNFVARFGALYELEFEGGYTLSPQLHYDASKEDALVFGISLGLAF
ncbi:hypothetical protein [Kordiimonas aquimaris]|uniref:hypothetical protein n=1 Tax=Kordiimonas aquimaris TaxID=707591 RepID=UPI0021D3BE23|nr:hypothetical protein [Kordiimonas aquimaris]